MAVKGVFSSDSGIVGDPKGDFAAALLQSVPTGSAPLFALTSGMTSRPATDTIVTWFEESHISGRTIVNGAVASTVTQAIVINDGSSYYPGVILMSELTGEYLYVIGVAGNTITCIRGFASSTAANIADGTPFQRIASAHEESSQAPTAVVNLGYPVFNYTQIFRNAWSLSGTAQAIEFYTGPQLQKSKKDAMLFHAEDIERALWFGRISNGTKNNQPFRTMNGLDAIVKTNVVVAGQSTNYDDIDNFLQSVFSKNIKGKPNERLAFGGNKALQVLNAIARIEGKIEIAVGQTDFGLNVNKWISPYGNITLMTHPLMVESPHWTGDMRLIHPGAMATRWLRRTNEDDYDKNGSRAGVDADYGVITSELSMEYDVEATGGRFTGMSQASAV